MMSGKEVSTEVFVFYSGSPGKTPKIDICPSAHFNVARRHAFMKVTFRDSFVLSKDFI